MGEHKPLKAPFPWFGGKSAVAAEVWQALGDVPNYVEPFAGSLAVLLGRPHEPGIETTNDRDGFICNVWRAMQHEPDVVAQWADWPVQECDLHARHVWLRERREALTRRLEGDPDYYDPKIAGWWLWGMACWIGGGWCAPDVVGPWGIRLNAYGYRELVRMDDAGQGVQRQLPHLGSGGKGVHRREVSLRQWMQALSERLRRVRVSCGDWTRVLGPSVTYNCHKNQMLTGIFLDPPYAHNERNNQLYGIETDCSAAVRDWAIANGDNPLLRIVLCGYEGEHTMPNAWRAVAWHANGGMAHLGNGRGKANARRERLWLSPHCLASEQLALL